MGRVSFLEKIPFGSKEYDAADEHTHQVAFCEWMRKEYPHLGDVFFAIPNGGSRNRVEAQNMVMEGVKAGIPDLCLAVPTLFDSGNLRYASLYPEMKTLKSDSKPSELQVQRINALRVFGNAAFVCHGWYQAVMLVKWYFGWANEKEILLSSGLNLQAQLSGDYSFNSWKFPL